jgi:hypothetical protein
LKRRTLVALCLVASTVFGGLPATVAEARPVRYEVVARGLANPRGVTVSDGGVVYVAEAGRGGSHCALVGGRRLCRGATGSVTRVFPSRQVMVAGLPSVAPPGGADAVGPADVRLRGEDTIFTVLGDLTGLPPALERPEFGTIQERITQRSTNRRADVSEYEALVDPDGAGVDSNPTSMTTDGTRFYAVDAGGNTLWRFNQYGVGTLVAMIPGGEVEFPAGSGQQVAYQAVPTAVAVGPDAGVYVSELTGYPYPVGRANVYRITDGVPVVFESGFTNIIDIAFGPDGSLYVLEIAKRGLLTAGPDGLTKGRLVRIRPDDSRQVLSHDELQSPGGVAVAPDGDVYVTNRATRPRTGQVLRYPAP